LLLDKQPLWGDSSGSVMAARTAAPGATLSLPCDFDEGPESGAELSIAKFRLRS
jgi:hypothetical protein